MNIKGDLVVRDITARNLNGLPVADYLGGVGATARKIIDDILFSDEGNEAITQISDPLILSTSSILVTHNSEELAIQSVSFTTTNIQEGVGFDVYAFAPNGASGQYPITITIT